MLLITYEVFAKTLSVRLAHRLRKCICLEQKWFVQGRYILDAIFIIWQGFINAIESKQKFLFVKVDYDKVYDRVEWSFILQSVKSMGCGPWLRLSVKALWAMLELECYGKWLFLYPIYTKKIYYARVSSSPLVVCHYR